MQSYLLFAADRSQTVVTWWGPNQHGYTVCADDAGRYSVGQAEQLEDVLIEGEETIAVPMSVARAGDEAVREFVAYRIQTLRRLRSA